MFNYTLTAEELEKLRIEFAPGDFICVATPTRNAFKPIAYRGTVVRVNDLGEIVVDWKDEGAPPVVVSEKAVKKINGK